MITKSMLNQRTGERLLRRARRVARIVAAVPFVRYVGLNGSLARGAATNVSDIDFFIATAPRRLWLTRLLITGLVQALGVRRTNRKVAGRVCLNRFFTSDHLEIVPHTLENAQTFAAQIPLYDERNVHIAFALANPWVVAFGYRFLEIQELQAPPGASTKFALEKALSGRFGHWIEGLLKQLQSARIARDPRTAAPRGRVIFSDHELTFNPPKSR